MSAAAWYRAACAAVLLALPAAAAQAQNLATGITATLIPSYQTIGGPDYNGVRGTLGFEGAVHFNFGRTAIGVGYRRHGHGFDLSELGPVPSGFDASVAIKGPHVELRQTFIVDPESKATLYVSLYGASLTQTVQSSGNGVRVGFDSDGFAAGSGAGVHYQLSPMLDLVGEWGVGVLWFDDFNVLQQQVEETESVGVGMAFKLGVRLRLARLLSGA